MTTTHLWDFIEGGILGAAEVDYLQCHELRQGDRGSACCSLRRLELGPLLDMPGVELHLGRDGNRLWFLCNQCRPWQTDGTGARPVEARRRRRAPHRVPKTS